MISEKAIKSEKANCEIADVWTTVEASTSPKEPILREYQKYLIKKMEK